MCGLRYALLDAAAVRPARHIHQLVAIRPPPPPLPSTPQASAGSAVHAKPPIPPPPPEQPHAETSFEATALSVSASEAGDPGASLPSPEQLLDLIGKDGIAAGLNKHWQAVSLLHEQEAFSVAQVAWIFDQCRHARSLKQKGKSIDHEAALPLGARVVHLFTHFVCARIPELTAEQTTCFVEALTGALPMDEFWLFMMAKQIQDTTEKFSPLQIATISRCYADNQLEDDEFFAALSERVTRGLEQFPLSELAVFLLACAKIRFLDEALCQKAFPLFEEAARVSHLDGASLSAAVTAAALLDWRRFQALHCCRVLAQNPRELQRSVRGGDLGMGLALATVYMRNTTGARLLLPVLLEKFSEAGNSLRMSEVAMIQRRSMIIGLCAAFGLPTRSSWILPHLRVLQDTIKKLQLHLDRSRRRDQYEPSPSSFHLEVVAVLRLLNVEHHLEYPQLPFRLDIAILPDQMRRAML